MASIMKFTHSAVVNQLRHVLRETVNSSNLTIDPSRSHLNYILTPERVISPYGFYKQRKSELYCFSRSDVKTLAGWVVTVPRSLSSEQQQAFFRESYLFLVSRYGQENTILAVVHQDESRPHLHFLFIPAAPESKHGEYKICANDVLTRAELRDFHPALQKHLKDVGMRKLPDNVQSSYDISINNRTLVPPKKSTVISLLQKQQVICPKEYPKGQGISPKLNKVKSEKEKMNKNSRAKHAHGA